MNDATMNEQHDPAGDDGEHRHPIEIFIDKQRFVAPQPIMTGQQLRALPNPPIGQDRDLWLEVPAGDDRKIGDDEPVDLHPGMHFFTTPRHVTPGSSHAAGR